MKYSIAVVVLFFCCFTLVAQEKLGVRSVISAAASKKDNLGQTLTKPVNGVNRTFTISNVSVQVGLPYLGLTKGASTNAVSTQNYTKDLGFPWGIRYRYTTFAEDAFSVSKGYYSDRIEINWDIKKNQSRITSITVYRTEDVTSANPNWGRPLKTLAGDVGTFSDTNVEGGKLYRYKLFAKGVEAEGLEILYSNFITGIGYRNPTGVITGNISFTGGNPVKDVLITANPTGSTLRFGSSLKVPTNSYISIPNLQKGLQDAITLQAWVKPSAAFTDDEMTLYRLALRSGTEIETKISLSNPTTLTVNTIRNTISLTNYMPSGEIDNKGDDILIPITALNSAFTHFSFVLRDNQIPEVYINGRLINAEYVRKMNAILAQNSATATATVTYTNNNLVDQLKYETDKPSWTSIKVGGRKSAYYDEMRIWEKALTPAQIQRDFRRYLQGNESGLNTYIRANEKSGDYAYDLAHTGFNFHGNNARLSHSPVAPTWANNEDDINNIPTNSQLGVLGVTDEFGNYVISSVPYSGNGDSFTIVPALGKHEFNPKQELAFLGAGSVVVNNVDFIDQSSFVFKGQVVYDSRGVFPYTSEVITGDIKDDESYNAYVKGNLKYQKGEYWAEKNSTGTIIRLRRYATIPVPDAYVSIDNVQAIDANNVPVQTDSNGRFTIEVPIGKHAISVSKSGHTFDLEGRYPARTAGTTSGTSALINTYQDFFEDRDEPITFIDTTKVIVVGRVVGGIKEAEKTVGFGFDGQKKHSYIDATGAERTIVYTSLNTIGKARMTLGYLPAGATSVTPEYRTSIETHAETGEYRVKLLPLNYLLAPNDLQFTSGRNPGNNPLLSEGQTINFTAIKALQYPKFVQGSTTITGQPFQEILKFTHIATPIYTVLSQTSDTQITANGLTYTIAANQATPIYTQFKEYSIQIQGQERYANYDSGSTPVLTTVPVEGGTILDTNNLALENSIKTEVSKTDPSIIIYSFKGGIPNTDASSNFKRTLDLKYRSNGVDTPLENYKTEGIILGGVADGTQTFVTAGPELPDFVLRDPPGSNSSATIEKGSSFSFTKENSSSVNNGSELNATVSLGFNLSLGGGLAGPVMETEVTNDVSSGVTMAQSSTNGKSVTNTYTFNQTISTSDDPNWIGSDADLYVGTSANQFYGTYNDLVASTTQAAGTTAQTPIRVVKPSNSNVTQLYPTINKALYFNEAPEKTLFVYSQHTILNEIIPKYEEFIRQIEAGTLIENTNGVLTKNAYQSSVNLWRKIILNNELAKYQALNDKDKLKSSLNTLIASLTDPGTNTLSASGKQLKDMLNATFYENISLDAGVGGFTKSYQVERLTSSSLSYSLQIDASIALAFGAAFNETGFEMDTKTNTGTGNENSSEESSNETTNISYTLKDSDPGNLLSVDVINAFDGNGPIFITKGGETSCPYEGQERSHFYNPAHPNVTVSTARIIELPEDQRKPLSVATIPLEVPEITVEAANVSGIFEGRNAEFVLRLRNTSTINKAATFQLSIDQSSNPDNALINIEPNGTRITIPAGQTVLYTMTLKKIKQDQFNYSNIRVLLESLCDGNATDEVLVSASFVPACSPVTIMSPPNNWLLNRNTAYDGVVTKPLNIKLGDYNTSFASFQKINLEYRLKGTPNWIGLRTFYKNQADYTTALNGGDTNVELIVGNQLNYAWDIARLQLGNGSYEIRARSSCYNQTAYESEISSGIVDLTAPVVFGTPTPKNGILSLGDDLSLRFSEAVKTNGTVTKFEFKVQKNQLPVKHEVSLAFNGASNTATIQKPHLTTGDFSIEFWLKNTSLSGTSTLLNQNGGIKIELIDSSLKFTIGGQSISATITNDKMFNYYALSYDATALKLTLIENSRELISMPLSNPINFTNENPIVIGGNSFTGNLHDLRFWRKYISLETAIINMNSLFNGNELNLLGYWPMNEGNGIVANDLARFKHLVINNASWDIFPKGTAYGFVGTNYLKLDQTSRVIISKEMDATLTFWMKTSQASGATLLSNGKGDATDAVESNGYRNKWAFNLTPAGGIELQAENKKFPFGTTKVNDDSWHHIALSLTRNGTIRLYVDGKETGSYTSADLGGFAASNLFVGARGTLNSVDNYYTGLLDELCIWNMSRSADQIQADRYHEVNFESTGLLLYSPFNKPETGTTLGPKYFTPGISSYGVLNGKPLAFSEITPGIKSFRPTETIQVNAVINGDQIVLVPSIADWASVEGKVAEITVSDLNDMSDNKQASPVTWNAYINKNPMKWFVEGQDAVVELMKRSNENLTFDLTVVNQSGQAQPYTIDVPNWLSLAVPSGTLAPNTTVTLKATVDNDLAIGNYNTVLSLATNYGYNEKIQLDLRVLEKEPLLVLDPTKFTQSMNIIGKVKLDAVFTDDLYDKVVAVVNGEVRGMTNVIFDPAFNEYFVYLTVYSTKLSGEDIIFYIWDATDGKLKEASLDSNLAVPFVADTLLGTYRIPAIFNNTSVTGQQIQLNQGWTWASFNVTDARFSNLNLLTKGLQLSTSDLVESNSPALFDAYQYNALTPTQSAWSGTISGNGGISSSKMYKIKMATAQNLNIKGVPVDLNSWSFNLAQNWNWLPYVVSKNVVVSDALANLTATDGDIIKSQSQFAIYTNSIGWKGSLTYLKAGEGYMMRVNTPQNFTYPEYLNRSTGKKATTKGTDSTPAFQLVSEEEETSISAEYAQYSNTMNAVVRLPEGYNDLAFYNSAGQLRGNSKTINIQGVDLAFITIYGKQAEKLTAFIGTGDALLGTTTSIPFSSDSVLGSIANPLVIDRVEEKIKSYPNPFHNELNIAVETKTSDRLTISLRNLLGQEVYKEELAIQLGATVLKINPNVPTGIYILSVATAGQVEVQKIIKI